MVNIPIRRMARGMVELCDQKMTGFNPRADMILKDGKKDIKAFITIEALSVRGGSWIFSGFLARDLSVRSFSYQQETDVTGWYDEKRRSGVLTILDR